VEAESITPFTFADKSVEAIAAMQVWEGNRKRLLGELFRIEGKANADPEEVSIQTIGDVSKVRRIGLGMSVGEINIEGDVDTHLGEEMNGGTIKVAGNAGSWAGSTMKGGVIEIKRNVGDYLGAPYRGSTEGMKGGTIIVHGNAGNEVGCFMRGGLIKVYGNVGQFAGMHMKGGTILVEGDAYGRMGAMMTGGKVVVRGRVPSVLPSFIIDGIRLRVRVGDERVQGPFYLFKGDVTESWDGSLYLSVQSNPHLKHYESKIA
jgi:formylmethanofuran dehydrogenase subunit C